MTPGRRIFRFGSFELDERLQELRSNGALVPLHATPMRLLIYLLENRAQITPKDALLRAVWPDVAVSDTALSTALKEIRHALGDDGARQAWIRTDRGRGYRWVGEVAVDGAAAREPGSRMLSGTPRAPSLSFVGRDAELAWLEQTLTSGQHVSVQAAVEGLAGIGKTELALQLAYRLAASADFPGGIFWLDAESPDLRSVWGTTIADQLRVAASSTEQRCEEVVRRIEESPAPVLIVLDNVESWSGTRRPRPLPVGPHVRLLVTTRSKNLGGAQFQHLDAGFLAPPHDRELVVRLAGRDPEPGLEHLLSHLAGHTLALELAGAFLGTYGGESAQSYHAALQQKGEAIETEVRDRVAYDATVAEAFRAIWSRMDDPLREAWRIAACFAPEPASRQLATAVGLTPEALRALEEFHVIRCAPDGRWSMHRLTQAFGRTAGPPDELRGAELRFVQGCAAYFRGVTRYNWVELLLPDRVHFDAALVLGAEVLPEHSDLLTQLRFGTAHGLDALGDFEGAQLIWRQAASSCQAQIASESHPPAECAVLYRQLADALILLAEREQDTSTAEESVHAYREALRNLDRAEEPLVWGGAQSALAYALLRLGADRRDPALLWDSVNAQRAALEELTRERDVLAWAECQRHLATALLTLGQVTNTDAYFDEAEATVRAILEECPRETFPVTWTFAQHRHSLVLMAIGERTGDAKRLDEALRGFRTLLESWTYERLPREWLMTQSNVASALLHLGRATGSVERLREALGTLRLVLTTSASGPRSDSWADAHDLLGTVLEALAAKQDAVPHLRDALDAYRTALEARDRDRFAHRWAETQYRIARVLGQLSNARAPEVRRDEILEALDRAREVWRSTGFRKGLDAVERELAKLAPPDPTHGST